MGLPANTFGLEEAKWKGILAGYEIVEGVDFHIE